MATTVQSLTSLLKQSDIEDHAQALVSAEQALGHSSEDKQAQHVRLVALLNLDRFADAVAVVEQGGAALKDSARLEYAYALYKAGRLVEAADIARKSGANSRALQHVEAQASYRMEDFARASDLYEQLITSNGEDATADLNINASAVDAQLSWSGKGQRTRRKRAGREDLDAFETAYNAACGCIARDELLQAEVLLNRAKQLCNAADDLSEEDKTAELLPINVQHVYVLARQGRLDDASKLSQSIDSKNISDESTRYIAQVNGVVASGVDNPYIAQRLIAKDVKNLKPDIPFKYQTSVLDQNRYAVNLQSLKFKGLASFTAAKMEEQAEPSLDSEHINFVAAHAAARAESSTGKTALKTLLPLLAKRPHELGLVLTVVQLYVSIGSSDLAIKAFEQHLSHLKDDKHSPLRFAPSVVAISVSLYDSLRRTVAAQRELAAAATYWRSQAPELQPITLLQAAGNRLIDSSDSTYRQLAGDIFADLYKRDPTDRFTAAGLIASKPNDTNSPDTLPPLDRLLVGIDAAALEAAGVPHTESTAAASKRKRDASAAAADAKLKKKAKMHKSRTPKNFDASGNFKPDPERWLPMKDRSYYKPPKGKKNKARMNALSQGAAPVGSGDASEASRPGTPRTDVVKGKQQGGGGQSKKKGKGKR